MELDEIFAFVLMPFHEEFDDIYRLGIKEPASALGIKAERVDEQIFREGILDRIYRQIEVADIVIADMSDQNANVFYEVGYAHGKEKICILVTKDVKDIPFDLKHHRHIVYGGSISKLRSSLKDDLAWAMSQIEAPRNSRIKVQISKLFGILEKTNFSAKGEIDFTIDLHNASVAVSSEIDSIYFYSTKSWVLKQDEKQCAHTDSDVSGFSRRHFIRSPVHRLHKASWAQLNFTAEKYFAFAHLGENFKNAYRVKGRSILRIVTPDGNFDYNIPIDVECGELPF